MPEASESRDPRAEPPPSRGGAWATGLVFVVGVAVSIAAFFVVQRTQVNRAQAEIDLAAREHLSALERELDTKLEALHSLRALFDSSQVVEKHEFSTFSEGVLARHPSIRMLAWVERIATGDQESFVRAVREADGADLEICEVHDGRIAPADHASRDHRLVVRFGAPDRFATPIFGLDFASIPALASAMPDGAGARNGSREPTMTGRISLPHAPDASFFAALLPVFERSGAPVPLPSVTPRGFVTAVIDPQRLLEEALEALPRGGLVIRIVDESSRADLTSSPDAPPTLLAAAPADVPPGHQRPVRREQSATLTGGGRMWIVHSAPLPGRFEAGPLWERWGVLAVGLLTTSLVALSVATAAGRARIQRIVEQRTADLARAFESLRAGEARFRLLVDGVSDYAIMMLDARGRIVSWSQGAERTTGYTADEIVGKPYDALFTPEEAAVGRPAEERRIASEQGRFDDERRRVRKDGSVFWASVVLTPLRREDGGLLGFAKIMRDTTERRKADERQKLMLRELDHRVKNNMAAVLAIVDHTARASRTLEEFTHSFRGRIMAMSRLHAMLAQTSWSGASLAELVRQTVEPYTQEREGRVVVRGEPLVLPAKAVSSVSMALHELATNAAKYGALSVPEGKVEITWRREPAEGGDELLRLRWVEEGGPHVDQPGRRGFGSELIETSLPFEMEGRANLEFAETGVRCELVVPLLKDPPR